VHHATRKAADMALAKKAISQESHKAISEGRISLDEAKSLGRNAGPDGPPKPESRISKDDRTPELCLCQCGERPKRPGSRWVQGHDARAIRWANAVARGEDIELTREQREYIESSGKLQKAREKVRRDEQRKAAKQGEDK
jgi:hypothetical protein